MGAHVVQGTSELNGCSVVSQQNYLMNNFAMLRFGEGCEISRTGEGRYAPPQTYANVICVRTDLMRHKFLDTNLAS
jgi:hypothetical protein